MLNNTIKQHNSNDNATKANFPTNLECCLYVERGFTKNIQRDLMDLNALFPVFVCYEYFSVLYFFFIIWNSVSTQSAKMSLDLSFPFSRTFFSGTSPVLGEFKYKTI